MGETYRTSGGRIGKIFGGKKFLLTNQELTKARANTQANIYRKQGYLVRITKHKTTATNYYPYRVWRRARTAR